MEKQGKGERNRHIRKVILHFIVCICLLVVVWCGYVIARKIIYQEINNQIELCEDDFSWVYQVDSIAVEDDELVLTGFAFQLGKDAVEDKFEIMLQELETGERIFLNMRYFERSDVNEYFLCKNNYLKSGFKAKTKLKKLDLQGKDYEVLLRVRGENKAYLTGTYLTDGQLFYTNPTEYVPLEVTGTELEEIIESGVLRVYESRIGVYVYQYDGKMYWVFDRESVSFRDSGDMWLQYILYTTQNEKLPEESLAAKCMWNNSSFAFSRKEISLYENEEYRVACCEIPKEHSVTLIKTGHNNEDTSWGVQFRPWYSFSE